MNLRNRRFFSIHYRLEMKELDKYFEEKKRMGYVFTMHNIDDKNPYYSAQPDTSYPRCIEQPGEVSWWSHLSGRYRDSDEQAAFIAGGCVDRRLPAKALPTT